MTAVAKKICRKFVGWGVYSVASERRAQWPCVFVTTMKGCNYVRCHTNICICVQCTSTRIVSISTAETAQLTTTEQSEAES